MEKLVNKTEANLFGREKDTELSSSYGVSKTYFPISRAINNSQASMDG